MYGDENNIYKLKKWIEDKIDATWRNNRRSSALSVRDREALEFLSAREMDLLPNQFVIYSTGVEASVYFNLNKATGKITVSFHSETFGSKGGNPWWCLATPRPDSSTCAKIATADAPYDISILEYLQQNVVVQTGPTRATSRRPTRRSSSSSRYTISSNSNRSSRRETAAIRRGSNASRRRSRA
jgi:hypothetical protein